MQHIQNTCIPKLKNRFLLIGLLALLGLKTQAQITVNSLRELMPYLDDNNVEVKLKPGTYTITAKDIHNGDFSSATVVKNHANVLFLFSGNNSVYDFSGVTINIKTEVLSAFKSKNTELYEIQITGNKNVLKNLTMADVGSVHDAPTRRATNIVMDGAHNRIEGFHVTTKGSFPYGYGDAFGKGGKSTINHRKHSACLIRGESNHLKNSSFIHRSYGHCIFMQAANNPLIEGCTVEGEVRKTDDMLAEAGTGSAADKVDFMTVWGYKLPAGYMLSTGEAGIRAYNAGETVIDGKLYKRGTSNVTVLNCTIKYMRTGVTIAHATGKKYVEGCVAIGCENGYSLGSGDVVNCKADCAYGPAYSTTYENDKNYHADITIIPAVDAYYNGSGSIAYIGGSGHKVTFRGTEDVVEEGLAIKVGGDKNSIRLMYGNFPHQNNFKASNFELNNLSKYPVFLSEKSSGVKVTSGGTVTDLGKDNQVKQIKLPTKK